MESGKNLANDKIKVLIVEDSITQAVQLQYVLEQNNYLVSVAYNGKEALAKIKKHLPRIVISDIVMPEMNGFEFCYQLRKDKNLKEIPVILLTQLSDPEDVIKALECGADNFITKPYEEQFLISRIKNILTTQELRKKETKKMGMEIFFAGKKRIITSERAQIVDLLISTYENALQKNLELQRVNKELVITQHELKRRNEELEKLNEQKNQFLGMAAHDLRSPLGLILAYSNFLSEQTSSMLNESQAKFLSVIQLSSKFMLGLINDLLDISKIESGKLQLNLEKMDLLLLIKRNVELNNFLANKKQIAISLKCDKTIPEIIIDSAKVEQVFNNLISNAIKYSYPSTKVEINIEKTDHDVIISVIDQGQGIPTEELGKLFEPFEKTSVRATGGEKSTGLGLAIVKKIIEGHQGKIWTESEVGKGSKFHFTLPLKLYKLTPGEQDDMIRNK